jgi:hypothetical protein
MNRIKLAVVIAGLGLAANGAFAQDAAKRAEELRNSSEMMKPQVNGPERTMAPATSRPQSEAERRAEELRISSEMMRPPTNVPAGSMDKAPLSSPPNSAESKAAAEREKSELMKPQ